VRILDVIYNVPYHRSLRGMMIDLAVQHLAPATSAAFEVRETIHRITDTVPWRIYFQVALSLCHQHILSFPS
jgi:hypothetical protein